ncbi:MAG: glycosyltransferase family 4 protein [Chloroherpetonaceae bacterium]|nr:glycosyltransferase family 4 protein [Chloroherpetonaceae bacterium]MDW8436671.1 glycosyltransferase family 1 protein [Chloroherpetonaceae bacterium]
MRIAVDALLLKNQNSGTGFYTHNLLRAIAEERSPHRFSIFVGAHYERANEFNAPNIEIRKVNFRNGVHRIAWEQTTLVAELNRLKPDLLFCPFFIKPLLYKGKTVITMHDLYHRVVPKAIRWDRRIYRRVFIDRSAAQAHHVIAISELTKRDTMTAYRIPGDKISVVYNGIDEAFRARVGEEHKRAVLKKFAIPFSEFLLSVSTQHRNKNFGQLLEAIWKLKSRGKIFPLVIAGNKGDDSERLSRLTSDYDLSDVVKFVGFVGDEDLPALYQSAKAFVFPSLYEGFGIPLVEAMASGVPTIYANRGALPEVSGGSGIAFETTDELMQAIERLWQDEALRKALIEKGLQRSTLFSWREAAKATIRVFEKLC